MESKITSFSIARKWKSKDTIYNWQTKLQKAKFKKKKEGTMKSIYINSKIRYTKIYAKSRGKNQRI